ncbi:TPA: UMP kinase [Candidatus Woesearchaeota archaeon]|nr:UMP kinase [Candidatus Woesearchaeota archaeon]
MLIKLKTDVVVISLGGSLICPDGLDVPFLKKFRALIEDFPEKKFGIVCGGGKLARNYASGASEITAVSEKDLDWIGIRATHLHAEVVRSLFDDFAYPEIIVNPTKKLRTKKMILVAGGWKPGWSTDMDAVLLAKNIGAKLVINLSNIDHVYDKDPRKYKDAKKIVEISWDAFLRYIVGEKWKPGMNTPFDPVASREAKKAGMDVIVTDGRDIENLRHILEKAAFFKGTVIHG